MWPFRSKTQKKLDALQNAVVGWVLPAIGWQKQPDFGVRCSVQGAGRPAPDIQAKVIWG